MKKTSSLTATERTFYNNLFVSVAEEMGVTLMRSAHSPNIKERKDFSCAIFSDDGRLVAQAAHIPVHLGALPATMKAVRKRIKTWSPGDVVIVNDPFCGGTHLPDITLVSPVFHKSKSPEAFLVTRAHHADVGGISPGSLPLSRHIDEEGYRFTPQKLISAGHLNHALWHDFLNHVRTPDERKGDLRAQLAAHHTGTLRMDACLDKYGAKKIRNVYAQLFAYGRRLMSDVVKAIPDGAYSFKDVLEDDGQGSKALKICVRIEIRGSKAYLDFSGSSAACEGSLNAVEAITRSAVYYCFLCLLITPSKLHPQVLLDPPMNDGCFAPIQFKIPNDSILNASYPHAVAGGNVETSQRIVDVVLGALAKALPEIIPAASQGTMNNLTLGGIDPRTQEAFAYYETTGGGQGAHANGDGGSAVQVHMTNTLNTPVEALEYAYPFRVKKYSIASKAGGQGKYQGGAGIERALEFLGDAEAVLLTERRKKAPYGLKGGGRGALGENRLNGRLIQGKCSLAIKAGDVLRIKTPGGGGFGKAK